MSKFIQEHGLEPCGCFEIYHDKNEPIEFIRQLDHKDAFEKLKETKFVAANLL